MEAPVTAQRPLPRKRHVAKAFQYLSIALLFFFVTRCHTRTPPSYNGARFSRLRQEPERTVVDVVDDEALPRLRLCVGVLLDYERRTLLHWAAYHMLIGFESIDMYVDDRREPLSETDATFLRPLRRHANMSVLTYRKEGLEQQLDMIKHCYTKAVADGIDWVAFWDADEYLTRGPPVRRDYYHGNRDRARFGDIRTEFARRLKAHVDVLMLPRTDIANVRTSNGTLVGFDAPPTDQFGPRYFEPRLYTTPIFPLVPHCPGKYFIRASDGGALQEKESLGIHKVYFPQPEADQTQSKIQMGFHPLKKFQDAYEKCREGHWSVFPNYTSLRLYHYISRSVEECKTKEHNQKIGGHRQAVRVETPGGKIKPSWRGQPGQTRVNCDAKVQDGVDEATLGHDFVLSREAEAVNAYVNRNFGRLWTPSMDDDGNDQAASN